MHLTILILLAYIFVGINIIMIMGALASISPAISGYITNAYNRMIARETQRHVRFATNLRVHPNHDPTHWQGPKVVRFADNLMPHPNDAHFAKYGPVAAISAAELKGSMRSNIVWEQEEPRHVMKVVRFADHLMPHPNDAAWATHGPVSRISGQRPASLPGCPVL